MNALETLIATALNEGKPTCHEVMPEDFGPYPGRANLLHECLLMVLSRYPRLQVQVVGSPDALNKAALVPGAKNRIGLFRVPANWGPTQRPGAIRLVFCRGIALAGPAPRAGMPAPVQPAAAAVETSRSTRR
jgi:hypothetical protein